MRGHGKKPVIGPCLGAWRMTGMHLPSCHVWPPPLRRQEVHAWIWFRYKHWDALVQKKCVFSFPSTITQKLQLFLQAVACHQTERVNVGRVPSQRAESSPERFQNSPSKSSRSMMHLLSRKRMKRLPSSKHWQYLKNLSWL